MGTKKAAAIGGGSGAVVTSSHAGCERFRGTDPLITGQSRRALAKSIGVSSANAGQIPESRWIRALTFQALVYDEKFASRIVEQTLAGAGLPRPRAVTVLNANEQISKTKAHLERAVELSRAGTASLIHAPAVPPRGFDESEATSVLPDFLVVTADPTESGRAVMVVGDAKDFERIRSRIDDSRMLKGFLQVAFGIAAFESWPDLPSEISLSQFGALAVPRNAFLQPTVVSENLADHKQEVLMRLDQRMAEAENLVFSGEAEDFVLHLQATYDPDSCRSCPLFEFCRRTVRESSNPLDLLQEIGIPRSSRTRLAGLITDGVANPKVPSALSHQTLATTTGKAIPTGQRRTDPALRPGTLNVVLAKSDSAALGVYGMGIQVVSAAGPQPWKFRVFPVPQSDQTRREILYEIGLALSSAAGGDILEVGSTKQFAIISPDSATTDMLASIADTVAGNEISRLRWERDVAMNRPPLTFDGNPAVIPSALSYEQRLATSFLVEEDRARAFQGRRPTVNLAAVLAELFTVGGPASSAKRLDYITEWAKTIGGEAIDYRTIESEIESRDETPGARLTVLKSNEINEALVKGKLSKSSMSKYAELVRSELEYKVAVFEDALEVIRSIPSSNLREAVLKMECEAQQVWRRRFEFHAFDLVRFGLTPRPWRNALVEVVEKDAQATAQLRAITNPVWADSQAKTAGNRELAIATVTALEPIRLEIDSRRFKVGDEIILLHANGIPFVEAPNVSSKPYATFLKVLGLPKARLQNFEPESSTFELHVASKVEIGDQLVIAVASWFAETNRGDEVKIVRAQLDNKSSPTEKCTAESFQLSPEQHLWCCRPHESREAEMADWFAAQREQGKMNPQSWPPLVDSEAFGQESPSDPTADDVTVELSEIPADLTSDELQD